MNIDQMLLTVALGAALAAGTPAVQAQYLSPTVEARLQAAADHGPDQLRQYVWRTRAIHAIGMEEAFRRTHLQRDYSEYANVPGDAAVEPTPGKPARARDDTFNREFFRNDARD